MIAIRRSEERGRFDHGWLDTRHTFSFADYHDPRFMGFRSLRVINEDRVRPGGGFGRHPHTDMEIITCVISGELEHHDSLGNGAVLRAGDIQYMSAGTGVLHSEFNPSASEMAHFMQIWIEPSATGLPPRYEQRRFPQGESVMLVSPDGRDGSILIRQDAVLLAASLRNGRKLTYATSRNRAAWVQVIEGEVTVLQHVLHAGDAASLTDVAGIELQSASESKVLVFDLA